MNRRREGHSRRDALRLHPLADRRMEVERVASRLGHTERVEQPYTLDGGECIGLDHIATARHIRLTDQQEYIILSLLRDGFTTTTQHQEQRCQHQDSFHKDSAIGFNPEALCLMGHNASRGSMVDRFAYLVTTRIPRA